MLLLRKSKLSIKSEQKNRRYDDWPVREVDLAYALTIRTAMDLKQKKIRQNSRQALAIGINPKT